MKGHNVKLRKAFYFIFKTDTKINYLRMLKENRYKNTFVRSVKNIIFVNNNNHLQ